MNNKTQIVGLNLPDRLSGLPELFWRIHRNYHEREYSDEYHTQAYRMMVGIQTELAKYGVDIEIKEVK